MTAVADWSARSNPSQNSSGTLGFEDRITQFIRHVVVNDLSISLASKSELSDGARDFELVVLCAAFLD